MTTLIFASHNLNKAKEIAELLPENFQLQTLTDLGFHEEIPETGETFEANALLKASYLNNKLQTDTFADDSGLLVKSLNGAPGVYSARYAGTGNADDNMNKLLSELEEFEDKSAHFKTVIALIQNNQTYYFEGIVNGKIISEKRGNYGFGYDPIFIPEGESRTFAEMQPHEKAQFSHRAQALAKMMEFLENQ